jgi:hypothetical protein
MEYSAHLLGADDDSARNLIRLKFFELVSAATVGGSSLTMTSASARLAAGKCRSG